jgi:hypothetical protein
MARPPASSLAVVQFNHSSVAQQPTFSRVFILAQQLFTAQALANVQLT